MSGNSKNRNAKNHNAKREKTNTNKKKTIKAKSFKANYPQEKAALELGSVAINPHNDDEILDLVNELFEEPEVEPKVEKEEILEELPETEEDSTEAPKEELEKVPETSPVSKEAPQNASKESVQESKLPVPQVPPQVTPAKPRTLTGVTKRQLIASTCLFISFSLLYNVLIRPYDDKTFAGPALSTTTVVCTEPTTTEPVTTTETTTVPETTLPPAAPVTKVYKPKKVVTKAVAAPKKKVVLNVPFVCQNPDFPTGCEAASAAMLLRYYGFSATVHQMVSIIPRENLYKENGRVYGPSIYQKFVGDPRYSHRDPNPGHGAFSPVITNAMNIYIKQHGGGCAARNITGTSVEGLFAQIDAGNPVVIWATSGMKTPQYVNSWYIKTPNGDQYFEYPLGTHVYVLKGYDSRYVYCSDPWVDVTRKYTISAFADKYALLGKQAIIIVKGAIPETTASPTTTAATTTKVNEPSSTTTSTEENSEPDTTDEEESSTTTTTEEESSTTTTTVTAPEVVSGSD